MSITKHHERRCDTPLLPRSCTCDECVPMYDLADKMYRLCDGVDAATVAFAAALITAIAAFIEGGHEDGGSLLGDTQGFADDYLAGLPTKPTKPTPRQETRH